MPRILYNPDSETLIAWPRQDDEDVIGLQPPVVMLRIEQEPRPDYDEAVYQLSGTEQVDLAAGVLRRGWELLELPPPPPEPPVARWVEFAGALAATQEIRALLWAIEAVNPVLRDMIGVGMGQAAQGDAATFLAAWGQAVAAGMVAPELIEEMKVLAEGFDLPTEFVEGLG